MQFGSLSQPQSSESPELWLDRPVLEAVDFHWGKQSMVVSGGVSVCQGCLTVLVRNTRLWEAITVLGTCPNPSTHLTTQALDTSGHISVLPHSVIYPTKYLPQQCKAINARAKHKAVICINVFPSSAKLRDNSAANNSMTHTGACHLITTVAISGLIQNCHCLVPHVGCQKGPL